MTEHTVAPALYHLVLLAQQLSEDTIALVNQCGQKASVDLVGADVESVRPLYEGSRLVQLCVPFHADDETFKSFFKCLRKQLSGIEVDWYCLPDAQYRCQKRLVVFDMDSTLIEQEVIDELADCAGVKPKVSEITEAAMRGEIDFKESFAKRLKLINQLTVSDLDMIVRKLTLSDGAMALFTFLKQQGIKTALISGGFDYFARHIQKMLGIDYVFANTLCIDGERVVGQPVGEVIDGQVKARIVRELATKYGLSFNEIVAVGDGANDVPMLLTAGVGVAFRAKPLVQEKIPCAINYAGLDGVIPLVS